MLYDVCTWCWQNPGALNVVCECQGLSDCQCVPIGLVLVCFPLKTFGYVSSGFMHNRESTFLTC